MPLLGTYSLGVRYRKRKLHQKGGPFKALLEDCQQQLPHSRLYWGKFFFYFFMFSVLAFKVWFLTLSKEEEKNHTNCSLQVQLVWPVKLQRKTNNKKKPSSLLSKTQLYWFSLSGNANKMTLSFRCNNCNCSETGFRVSDPFFSLNYPQ